MSNKQDIQIALGAAVAANCIPCFEHLFEKAKEIGLETEEIQHVVKIATKVKNGAHVSLKTNIDPGLCRNMSKKELENYPTI
jgi:alkylhydroperoxidase/carboxymuconolactone decarboxylase family protein YurZ